jgi:hypothetical protein
MLRFNFTVLPQGTFLWLPLNRTVDFNFFYLNVLESYFSYLNTASDQLNPEKIIQQQEAASKFLIFIKIRTGKTNLQNYVTVAMSKDHTEKVSTCIVNGGD